MYSLPPENIGVACQQEEFDPTALKEHFQKQLDQMEPHTDELKRIPLIRKRAAAADIMDMKEVEEKIGQYCQLWELYAQVSCELTRRSKISQNKAAKACKVYGPHIRDILQQVNEVMTIFVKEKELRSLKGRGHFPYPQSPHKAQKLKTPTKPEKP